MTPTSYKVNCPVHYDPIIWESDTGEHVPASLSSLMPTNQTLNRLSMAAATREPVPLPCASVTWVVQEEYMLCELL